LVGKMWLALGHMPKLDRGHSFERNGVPNGTPELNIHDILPSSPNGGSMPDRAE